MSFTGKQVHADCRDASINCDNNGPSLIQRDPSLVRFFLPTVCLMFVVGCTNEPAAKQMNTDQNTGQKNTEHNQEQTTPTRHSSTKSASNSSASDLKKKKEISVLFLGNSHSAPIPKLLAAIYAKKQPSVKTKFRTAPSFGFLAQQVKSKKTTDMIKSGNWDYVVLQAQKYSTTGKYTYPTDAAIELAEMAQAAGSKVLMYPEWSRKGVPDEYARIRKIHDGIAKETGARVAPIGECWNAAIDEYDIDGLHASDGNHASNLGSYLNACVFYSIIADDNPSLSTKDSSKVRNRLANIAWRETRESKDDK